MGRSYQTHRIPFLLYTPGENSEDLRLEASWEEPEDERDWWGPVNGWEPGGEGDIVGDTQWRKGDHVVEVCYACLVTRSRTFYASRDRASLEAWKRDHGLGGRVHEDHEIVVRG